MTESSLSVTYSEIEQAILDFLGEPGKDVDAAIREGYRAALVPPPLQGGGPHTWKFLEPVTTIAIAPTVALVATSTVTGLYSSGTGLTTLTCTGATPFLASMVGLTITITDVNDFVIAGVTSTAIVTVTGNATCVAKTFQVQSDGEFALPDDFADIKEGFWYQPRLTGVYIVHTPEGDMRNWRTMDNTAGIPTNFCIVPRPKTSGFDPAEQTRWNAIFWPPPMQAYTLTYKYRLLVNELSDSNPYPVGGMEFGQLVLAAAVAKAETKWRGGPGQKMKDFMTELTAAVARDCAREPMNLGENRDLSDGVPYEPHSGISSFQYNGHA